MIKIKTESEIEIMTAGGKKLVRVKNALKEATKIGVKASDIEELAKKLIKAEGAEGSFDKVPGYSWVTCINVNAGLVHGVPGKEIIFKKGDVVSVDVGLYYKGFHTDTSFSVGLDVTPETQKFLNVGQNALEAAIRAVKADNYVFDISRAIELTMEAQGYTPIKALVGHGVGRELHEEPQIPCFVPGRIADSSKLVVGMTLAVEVMYAQGSDKVEILPDGWTIAMRDGKISALFEETVVVTQKGPKVLTR